MTAPRVLMTYADYAALPDEAYTLSEGAYVPRGSLEGDGLLSADPFPGLIIRGSAIWA